MLCIPIGLMHTPFFLKIWLSIASAGQLEDSIFDQWSIVDGILGFCPAGILVSEMGTSSAFRTVEPLRLQSLMYNIEKFLCVFIHLDLLTLLFQQMYGIVLDTYVSLQATDNDFILCKLGHMFGNSTIDCPCEF